MPKGVPHKRYTSEFKKHVVETMLNEGLTMIMDMVDSAARRLSPGQLPFCTPIKDSSISTSITRRN